MLDEVDGTLDEVDRMLDEVDGTLIDGSAIITAGFCTTGAVDF
jgi:hypothetical protein